MPPTSCLVSEKTLAELFLKHYKSVDNTTFGGATAEAVHAMNRKFLADVWTITSRLTASVIRPALKRAWPALEAYQVRQICSLLPESFQALRKKSTNYKTGERMPKFYGEIFSPSAKPRPRLRGKVSPEKKRSIESQYGLNSPAPAPSLEASPGSSQECLPAPAPSIEAMYGLPDRSRNDAPVIEVASSQERAPEKQTPHADLPSWWNACAGTMELQDPLTGKPIQAKTELGGQGFLVARWPDGSVTQTEVSNLAKMHANPPAPVMRSPAAASTFKRPAAASTLRRPAAVVAEPVAAPCTPPTRPPAHSGSPVQPAIGIFSPSQNKIETASFGKVRKHIGDNNGYIQHWDGSKWACLVHVTNRMCGGMLPTVINQLMAECTVPGQTKENLHRRKAALCASTTGEDVN